MSTPVQSHWAWPYSLIGRDWEIYWESEENKANRVVEGHQFLNTTNHQLNEDDVGQESGDDQEKEGNEAARKDDQNEYADDWYDGKVISFKTSKAGGLLFLVQFAGDDETSEMELTPSVVRPCARAWIKRSCSLLSLGVDEMGEPNSRATIEELLPDSSSTLSDLSTLSQLSECVTILPVDKKLNQVFETERDSHTRDRQAMRELLYLSRCQIHLRQKLAKIVADQAEKGESEMSEVFVNYLTLVLEETVQVCLWYEKAADLHYRCFGGTGEMLEVDEIQKCIEEGFDRAIAAYEAVASPSAAKRRHQSTSAVPTVPQPKCSKRRKLKKIPAFVSDSDDKDLWHDVEAGGVVPTESMEYLLRALKRDNRWILHRFAGMLSSLFHQIQSPLLQWRKKADLLIGSETAWEPSDEEGMETEKMFTFNELVAVLTKASDNPVLKRIKLDDTVSALDQRKTLVENFEVDAWRAILLLFQDPELNGDTGEDRLVSELQELERRATEIGHISPLATNEASTLTSAVIGDAISLRNNFLNLCRVSHSRERLSFVRRFTRDLPCLPEGPAGMEKLREEVANMKLRFGDLLSTAKATESRSSSYSRKLHVLMKSFPQESDLLDVDRIRSLIQEMEAMPLVTVVEEKLRAHLDVLLWNSQANDLLHDRSSVLAFSDLSACHAELTRVLKGDGRTRRDSVADLAVDQVVEKEIQSFIMSDLELIVPECFQQVSSLYQASAKWRSRAQSVIVTLQQHGNDLLTENSVSSTKALAMVDTKRIKDLIDEHSSLGVAFPHESVLLQKVYDKALAWSLKVSEIVKKKENLTDQLRLARDQRPKGIIMEPPRHVVDLWLEALDWHERLMSECKSIAENGQYSNEGLYSFQKLAIEGIELVHEFSLSTKSFPFEIERAKRLLSDSQKRPVKVMSIEKLIASQAGKSILEYLFAMESSEQYPITCLLFVIWRCFVIEMVDNASKSENDKVDTRPSLESAAALHLAMPSVSDNNTFDAVRRTLSNVCLKDFHLYMEEAEGLRDQTKDTLNNTRELIRGSYGHSERVKAHLGALKELQSTWKVGRSRGMGFAIGSVLEKQLDQRVKDVTWLVKTLPYPALHSDDVDLETGRIGGEAINDTNSLPWDILVVLHDRLPPDVNDATIGDIARVGLRVKELFEAANEWQDEVSALLSLSFRGSKRREPGGSSNEESDSQTIDMTKLAQLAKHSILKRVSMPREQAVRDILQHAHGFEVALFDMFGKDYEGKDADRAAYPESDSLVGTSGEFHIFRLTESPLFKELATVLHRIDQIRENIHANTADKAAFEWIESAVRWIQELRESVSDESAFANSRRLVIPNAQSKELLEKGKLNLVDAVSEDVKKTLSSHRIFVSADKGKPRLSITIAKGAPHHSLGATALKWASFLFTCLKSDVDRLNMWVRGTTEQAEKSKTLSGQIQAERANVSPENDTLYLCYCWIEETREHMMKGENLVCSPRKNLVDVMDGALNSFQQWLDTKMHESKGLLDYRSLKRRRYTKCSRSFSTQHLLLDDLVHRQKAAQTSRSILKVAETTALEGSVHDYRKKAHKILTKSLLRGMKLLNVKIQVHKEAVNAFCEAQAWRLEQAVFDDHFDDKISYRDKVNSLRSNLQDVLNPNLSGRFLNGELGANALVQMTDEQMKSTQIRKRSKGSANETSIKDTKGPKATSSKNSVGPSAKKARIDRERDLSSSTAIRELKAARNAGASLSVPPSLAMVPSKKSMYSGDAIGEQIGKLVVAKDGSHDFTFTVGRFTFETQLYTMDWTLENFLPKDLRQKGKIMLKEFSSFITSKLSSGAWWSVALRMKVVSGMADYKKFYRDYENRQRIAFFSVTDLTKIFVVTPKFQSLSKELQNQLTNKHTSYAVVISKEAVFHD